MDYYINLDQDLLEADLVIQEPDPTMHIQASRKGDDTENDSSLGQEITKADVMVFDESIQETQLTVDIREPLQEDVDKNESGGKESDHASLKKLGSEPYTGLQFGSEDEAYEFYNAYAKEKGFSIRKSRVERSKVDKSVLSRKYVCAHEGFHWTKDKRYKGKVVRSRRETRVDCQAAMSIKRKSGGWMVYKVHHEHNHELVNAVEAYKLRSHRKMMNTMRSIPVKREVGPSENKAQLQDAAQRADNVGINNQDSKNYVNKERKINFGVDWNRTLEYFQSMQSVDSGFFYAAEFGMNQSIRSLFWVDSRAREAYKQFGDVVVFDTSYQTDKYRFPLVSFTGVNHHRHSTVFGSGLLADETVESYVWLFETWLKAMLDQQPPSLITYQDEAMRTAIEKVFPGVRHRFCMWHVAKNELENLGYAFKMHKEFEVEYRKCIHASQKPEEFELGWEALIVKFGLKDNNWLKLMYDQRHHWVPLYLQDAFFAGMTTIKRSEGINSYLNEFLHEGTPLSEFIPQYDHALKQLREKEADEDFVTMHTKTVLTSKSPIEEQAARVFTRTMFSVFRHGFLESSCCIANKTDEEGPVSKYLVHKYNEKDENMHVATFNVVDNGISCSCQMFEFEGMICRHLLKVFQMVNIFEIPPRYILKRWTMSARYLQSIDGVGGCSGEVLKETATKFVEFGSTCTERTSVAINILRVGMGKLSDINMPRRALPPEDLGYDSTFQGQNIIEHKEGNMPDLLLTKAKGHLVTLREKSGFEQSPKKKRIYRTREETRHNMHASSEGVVDQSHLATVLQVHNDHSHHVTMVQGPVLLPPPVALLPGPVILPHPFMMLPGPVDQSQSL
ncbi:protein FAR1-RELATED SEQUENCE 5-like [Macadamia integrifolia]|uniref:protein FAR1-RELATED SEQUENCE 5-like n=1 Tax=Macadamia integrifolia TaxID=60698 RepID=UPI001C4E8419|nr:protein FAR1-RELATED SEQUENCE 5-like [Macadamia integrifolia]XP_042512661.1 protein FAR1-RELATED SEQUENCE 5-like [Macadamia integrifolia]